MNDITCPYCDTDFYIDHDDGFGTEEDETYQQECPKCEKTFVFYVSWSPHYSPEKADCLNGGEHDWQQINGAPKEHFHGRQRCSMCAEERQTDEEGRRKAMQELQDRWDKEKP